MCQWLHHSKLVPEQVVPQLAGTAERKLPERVAPQLAGTAECKLVPEQVVLNMIQVLHLGRVDLEVHGVQRVQEVPDFRAIHFCHLRP